VSLGLRALGRQSWLAAVGLLVSLLRRGLAWPALGVGWLLLARGAASAAERAPWAPDAPLAGAALVLASPRFGALVLGLGLAGALLGLALRLAWLAGAIPALAGALGPAPDGRPRFAEGLSRGLPRLVPLAALLALMELAGLGYAAAISLGAVRISAVAVEGGQAWLAAPVALALVVALAVPLGLSLLADAALVRAAVRGEGPATALARATERLVRRPAALAAAALLFGALGLAAGVALSSLGGVFTGFASGGPALLLAGPRLMLSIAAAAISAALELWWLASLTALVTSEG
jgi:hypothetical protein